VTVVIKTAQIDAIHLASGCTGTIGKVTMIQYHGDGIIVGPGAHDVSIGGGSIRRYAHVPGKHQDGIQAMGGQRVTFTGLDDECLSANNSAMFINETGNALQLPSDIVWSAATSQAAPTRSGSPSRCAQESATPGSVPGSSAPSGLAPVSRTARSTSRQSPSNPEQGRAPGRAGHPRLARRSRA
jgi:hypothetical protein